MTEPLIPSLFHHVAHASGPALLAQAGAWLELAEPENNLTLSIAGRNVSYSDVPALWLTLHDDAQRIVGVAIQTPPHNLLVSAMPPAAVEHLADTLAALNAPLPGVIGPTAAAHAFAAAWCARRHVIASVRHEQRIYSLTTVTAPASITGRTRKAIASDRDLLVRWAASFHTEADLPSEAMDRIARDLDERIASERFFVLEDASGERVSMAAIVGLTPHGARVGFVYTPSVHRRRGHASTLVAEVSQQVLAEGRAFCFLYTDLANPTSNAIYQRIGYRPVGDAPMIRFAPVKAQ